MVHSAIENPLIKCKILHLFCFGIFLKKFFVLFWYVFFSIYAPLGLRVK
jgi:hypothetical protein